MAAALDQVEQADDVGAAQVADVEGAALVAVEHVDAAVAPAHGDAGPQLGTGEERGYRRHPNPPQTALTRRSSVSVRE